MNNQNYGLGRGLSSLIPPKKTSGLNNRSNYSEDNSLPKDSENFNQTQNNDLIQKIDISRIFPNPHQPRLKFDEERINELAASIKEHGIIQPIVVSQKGDSFEVIAGERRLQAAKLAELKQVPVVIKEVTEQQKLELAIVENIQRYDLNSIEEAQSYLKLSHNFGLSQEEIAYKVGKSRSAVANKMRLLKLPIEIQKALIEGRINEGHAKAILAIENSEKQRALFELILKNGLTVRQTEDKTKEVSVKTHQRKINIDPEVKEIENRLINFLGTKVKLSKSGQGGRIIIDYYSKEELNNLLSKIVQDRNLV